MGWGKTQLLDDIKKTLPRDLSQRGEMVYVEPFVGGGAVMFWILHLKFAMNKILRAD